MTLSVRARLIAWYTAVMVGLLAVAAFAAGGMLIRLGIHRLDADLLGIAATVHSIMRDEAREGMDLTGGAHEASTEVTSPGVSVILSADDGKIVASWGEPLPAQWEATPGLVTRVSSHADVPDRTVAIGDKRFRVVERTALFGDKPFAVTVLGSLELLERQRSEFLYALSIGFLVALAVGTIGGWAVSRRALAPLTAMAREATAITERDPEVRLQVPPTRDELGQLGTAFNALLDRLSAALLAQRQFMADASHQMRTPVSVLQTTAQVMLRREGREEREYRESLTIVGEQSARLARLVDAMFLLARAEAGGWTLRTEPLYLDELVSECARAVAVVAAERNVTVATRGDADVPFMGDDALLRHMAINLLENAVRYTRTGSQVVASLDRTADGIVLRVTDEGPGIPEADRERIFERFVRLDQGSGGAGLGLAMARRIAEVHDGCLTLESSDARGSCFAVTLPLRAHAIETPTSPTYVAPDVSLAPEPLNQPRG
jgi:signal transduction histidine kinase